MTRRRTQIQSVQYPRPCASWQSELIDLIVFLKQLPAHEGVLTVAEETNQMTITWRHEWTEEIVP